MNKKSNNIYIYAIILFGLIFIAGFYFYNSQKNIGLNFKDQVIKVIKDDDSHKKDDGWQVGAVVNIFAANPGEKFDANVFQKQVDNLKKLGVNHLRSNFEKNGMTPVKWANDLIVDSTQKNNWNLSFIVEDPFGDFFSEANYNSGYEWGKIVGAQYPQKVDYYQLANEVSGTLISSGNGMSNKDYDQKKYDIMKNYLMGLRDGIHEKDPNAKFIVSAHCVCYAIIDMLIEDGLEFDVIGWNWYSEMGDDLTKKQTDEVGIIDIPGHFAKTKKLFWITEVNQSGGDMDGEQKQADYLQRILDNSYNSDSIDGVFIFRFADTICTEGDQPTSHLGIIKDKKSNDTKSGCDIGDPKKAYYVVQNFIKKINK